MYGIAEGQQPGYLEGYLTGRAERYVQAMGEEGQHSNERAEVVVEEVVVEVDAL